MNNTEKTWKWLVAKIDERPVRLNYKLQKSMSADTELRRLVDISWILFIHNYKHLMDIPLPIHMIKKYGWKSLYIHELSDEVIIGIYINGNDT